MSAIALQLAAPANAGESAFDVPRIGFNLKGVLATPDGNGPFPTILLLPGSGPTDADGNSNLPAGHSKGIHNNPARQLTNGLVAAGYAVARINKRGLPPSTGEGNDVSEQDYVEDYLATLDVLQKQPTIDATRIVIAGHSEGGLISLLMAPRAPAIAYIFIESPGQPLTAITTDQVLTINRARGATPDQLAKIVAFQEGYYQAMAAAPEGKPLQYQGRNWPAGTVRYFKSLYAADPAVLAAKVKRPALVIQGTQDYNVAPENGKLLAAALPDAKLVMIDEMGHALTVAHSRDPSQLDVAPGTWLHPQLISAIVHWLQQTVPPSQ